MSKNYILIVWTLVLTIIVSSCGTKNLQRNEKQSDETYRLQQVSENYLSNISDEQKNYYQLLITAEAAYQNEKSKGKLSLDVDRLMNEAINPLKELVLSRSFLLDPDHLKMKTPEEGSLISRMVLVFNQSVYLVYSSNQTKIKKTDIFKRYKDLVLWDCDYKNKKSSCYFLRFFKSVDGTYSTLILKHIYALESSSEEKNKIISAAFEIKNNVLDRDLRSMLLDQLAEVFTINQKLKLKNKASLVDKRTLRNNAYLFANVLKLNVRGITNESDYLAILEKINPWGLSRNQNTSFSPAQSSLLKLAARHLMYNKDGKLSPLMRSTIDDMKYAVGLNSEMGAQFQLDNLKGLWKKKFDAVNEKGSISSLSVQELKIKNDVEKKFTDIVLFSGQSSKIIDNLVNKEKEVTHPNDPKKKVKLKSVHFNWDEYDYIAHQFYHGHYEETDAQSIWSGTNKNELRMSYAILNMIKLKIVSNIVQTNTVMSEFYEDNKDLPLVSLMERSEEKAQRFRNLWANLESQSEVLENFINSISLSQEPETLAVTQEIINIRKYISNNIKYLVTYPNMFTLMQFIAVNKKSDTIKGRYSRQQISIEWQNVISRFFRGEFEPLFDFGSDGDVLDSTQIIYSLYYAFLTEIFQTFSGNDKTDDSAKKFIDVVIEKIASETQHELIAAKTAIQTLINEIDSDQQHFINVCKEEQRLQDIESVAINQLFASEASSQQIVESYSQNFQTRKFSKSDIDFAQLDTTIYDYTNNKKKFGSFISKFYSGSFNEFLIRIKSGIEKNMLLARLALDMYSTYKNVPREKLEVEYQSQFSKVYDLRSEYLSLFHKSHSLIDGCDWLMAQRDISLRNFVIFEEVKFLGRVFDAMYDLVREKGIDILDNPTSEHIQAIQNVKKQQFSFVNTSFFKSDSPENISYRENLGESKLDALRLVTYKIDIFARIAQSLSDKFGEEYNIRPLGRRHSLYNNTDNDSTDFNFRALLDNKNQTSLEDIAKARQNFIDSGMKSFARLLGSSSWALKGLDLQAMKKKTEVMVNLYKLGPVSSDASKNCKPGLPQETNSCAEVKTSDLISHYKSFLDFLNINPIEEIFLNYMGLYEKYSGNDRFVYDEYIKQPKEQKIYSTYDLLLKRILTDLSQVTFSPKFWFSEDLVSFNKSIDNQNRSAFIFDYQDKINPIFEDKYGNLLEKRLQQVKTLVFDLALKRNEMAKNKEFNEEGRSFGYSLSQDNHKLGVLKDSALEPFVSDYMVNIIETTLTKLNDDTNQHFNSIISKYRSEIRSIINESAQVIRAEYPNLRRSGRSR